jgi:hypothetical protein
MSKQTTKTENDHFLSLTAKDRFTYIYEGTLTSKQFTALSPSARLLYLACASQRMSAKGLAHLHLFNQQHGTDYHEKKGYFTMPNRRLKEYGLKPDTCYRTAFKELINAGFIEIVEGNKHRHIENIYRLSTAWKKPK